MTEPDPRSRLSAWIWLALPLALCATLLGLRAVGKDVYERVASTEQGLVQNATVAFLVVAVVAALRLRTLRARVGWRGFGAFAGLLALACAFFAGEETSWGQHWLGFETPAVLAARNDQGELNLHNDVALGPVFDQLPRGLLTLAAVIGVVAPLVRRGQRRGPDGAAFAARSPAGWIWPGTACLPAALLALVVSLPEKLADEPPAPLDIDGGETKEMYLALFLMVYSLALLRRLRAAASPDGGP